MFWSGGLVAPEQRSSALDRYSCVLWVLDVEMCNFHRCLEFPPPFLNLKSTTLIDNIFLFILYL
jgi:hypothetical protein